MASTLVDNVLAIDEEKTLQRADSSLVKHEMHLGNEKSTAVSVRLDPHGVPLQPPPTDDPLDPLNWSRSQKYIILFIVCFANFLAVYLTGTTIASFFLLEELFSATYSQVNWTIAVPSLGLAVGPLLFGALADTWGRRPVLIGTTALAILATGCTTIRSMSLGAYMFTRFLQGVGAGPHIVIGFSMVRDISWAHERGFNVGLWVMATDTGGVMGSLVGGFTATTGPYWGNYHVVIGYMVLLLLEILVLPETLYPRELVLRTLAEGQSLDSLVRTRMIKPWRLLKIPGVSHPGIEQSALRFLAACRHPRLVLGLVPYVFLQYWWIVSLMTMVPAAYYEYTTQIQGLLFLGLVIGTVVTEVFISGRLSDIITSRLASRNNTSSDQGAERTPEMRLWLVYPGALLSCLGLCLWGASIDQGWHWFSGQVAFFLFAAGMQLGNAAVTTYVLDSFPNHIIEVMIFFCVTYNMSAFVNPWYINPWVEAVGYTWCFITQGLVCLLVIPAYACLQKWGCSLEKDSETF